MEMSKFDWFKNFIQTSLKSINYSGSNYPLSIFKSLFSEERLPGQYYAADFT